MVFTVWIYFVNRREVTTFTVNSERIHSPYETLQRILSSRGVEAFSAAWSDEYNNFFPLKSDANFVDALRARRHPLQPLRISVKESRLGLYPGQFAGRLQLHPVGNCRGEDANSSLQQQCDGPSMSAWSRHKENAIRKAKVETSVLPKDPSLAELLDKVRLNLDLVASMHGSIMEKEAVVEEKIITPVIGMDGNEKDNMVELLEEECAKLEVRPESVMSEEFMVITPSSDSCVLFNMADFEAAVSEMDNEDSFEIVDNPGDDWDSDVECSLHLQEAN